MVRSLRPETLSILLGSAILLLGASAASAQVDYARRGFYVGIGGSTGFDVAAADELNRILAPPAPIDSDTALGVNGRAGYRILPNLAAEAQIEWIDGPDLDVLGFQFASLEYLTFMANAKGYLLTGRWQPYGLVGIGGMYAKLRDTLGLGLRSSDTGFAARFGGGIDVYIAELGGGLLAASVDASYVLPTGPVADLDYVSLTWGFMYRF